MSNPKPYKIPDEAQNDLESLLSAYQTEVQRLKTELTQAIKYQKNYVILSNKTGYKVCPICDNGIIHGCNADEMPNIYLIDKTCKITVPILPFSMIDKLGAGMYKGEKISVEERKQNASIV